MMARLIVTLSLVALGWNGAAWAASRDHPYGLWTTERGHYITVRRDGTWVFCDRDVCDGGRYIADGKNVLLLGFGSLPVTAELRRRSGWDEGRAHLPEGFSQEQSDGLDLGDYGMSDDLRHRLCQDRPCRIVGRAEGDVFRFVKVSDG
jgi:hypothetical protein